MLARRDRRNLDRLAEELGGADGPPILRVPQLDGDVHDVAGLQRIRRSCSHRRPSASG